MAEISGSCLCGSVKYSCEADPSMASVCHCDNCQRQTGTAFSIIVGVPEDSLTFHQDDTLGEYLDKGDSGGAVQRRFCRNCGSPILSLVESAPGFAFLKAGTFDDKSGLKPSANFWCDSAQPWVDIDSELPKFDRNPG